MSAEAKALQVLRARKDSTVVMWVLLWTSFRCLIDRASRSNEAALQILNSSSDPVEAFGHDDLDDLKIVLTRCMRHSSPKGFSGTSSSAKYYQRTEGVPLWMQWHQLMRRNEYFYLQQTTDGRGSGLFARKDLSKEEVLREIFGWLAPIAEDQYEQLHGANHPSLYQNASNRYVLGGLLSCVNHDCGSPFGFSRPKPFPVDGYKTPSFATDNRESQDEWSAQLLTLQPLVDDELTVAFRKNEEIVVIYQDMFPDCRCATCIQPRQRPKKRGRKSK